MFLLLYICQPLYSYYTEKPASSNQYKKNTYAIIKPMNNDLTQPATA